MTTETILGRYDARTLRRLFKDAGIFNVLERRGFRELEVTVECTGRAFPHALLFGRKEGQRMRLLDACVGEAVVRPEFFHRCGYAQEHPVELAVVHWVREEDPTAAFAADRPPLPLQRHPGLGVLRQTFRVLAQMATEMGKDGIVSVPKFFHDAVIFFRSRLFLFLDGHEQGRFEAMMRDLRVLRLGDATLAVICGLVRDGDDTVVNWHPGYQVFPISAPLTSYFHSNEYAQQVARGLNESRFAVAPDAVAAARDEFREAIQRLAAQGAER